MDQFFEAVKEFFNQPVPIIGCTIGFLLISILTILAKTSIGKKALLRLQSGFAEVHEKYRLLIDLHNDTVKHYEKEIAARDEYIKQIETKYQEIIDEVVAKYEEEKDKIIDILEDLPNKKVQQKLLTYKKKDFLGEITSETQEDKELSNKQ